MSPSTPSAGDEPQSLDAALAAATAAPAAAAAAAAATTTATSATAAVASPVVLMPSFDGSSTSTSTSYPLPPLPNAASLATSTYLAPLPPPPPPPPSHVLAAAPVDATASFGDQLGVPMPLFPVDMPGSSAVTLAPRPAQSSESTERPPFPLATVIAHAIVSTPAKRATLAEIYAWMVETYPYYRTCTTNWKNTVRHTLSVNKGFVRLDKTIHHLGKGCYWTLDAVNGPPLLDRPSQRRSGWDDSRRSRARKSSKGVARVSTDVAAAAAAAAVGAYPSPASANSSGTSAAAGGVPFMPSMAPATRSDTGSVAPASQPASPAVANVLGVEPGWTHADFSRLLETVATAPPSSTLSTTRPAVAVGLGGQAAAGLGQHAGPQQAMAFAVPPTAPYAHGPGGAHASQHHGHAVPLPQQQSPHALPQSLSQYQASQHQQVQHPPTQHPPSHQQQQHPQQSQQPHALNQQQRQYAASALVQPDPASSQRYGAPTAHYTPSHQHAARPAQSGHLGAAQAPPQPAQGSAAQYYPSTAHAPSAAASNRTIHDASMAGTHARSTPSAPTYATATYVPVLQHQQFYGQQQQQQQHHHVTTPQSQQPGYHAAPQPVAYQQPGQLAYHASAHVHPHAHHHPQPAPPPHPQSHVIPHPHASYMGHGAVVVTAPMTAVSAHVGAVSAPASAPGHGGAHQQL
ncbi:Forkhead box protein J3 [Allomyces javanicus]|nr:Forkhead box protein J3 [Allomyces javanicus]